jgi:hypothetical protein
LNARGIIASIARVCCVEIGEDLFAASVGVRIKLIRPARELLHALGNAAARQALRAQDRVHFAVELRE